MDQTMLNRTVNEVEYRAVSNFVYLECQLADEGRWDEWEELLADDMHYWVPGTLDDPDPDRDVSIINDNRSRLATRLRQLRTGTRLAQAPLSAMRRIVSNLVAWRDEDGVFVVEANFVIFEMQNQSTLVLNQWPGRVCYRLRGKGQGFEMVRKRVDLIAVASGIPSLGFIV